jgi:hypothetical protein
MFLFFTGLTCDYGGVLPIRVPVEPKRYDITSGWATYYSPGVFEATVAVRQQMRHIPEDTRGFAGFVARPTCKDIGSAIWLRPEGADEWLPFMIADCARRDDGDGTLTWMAQNNILVELDYPSWSRWGRKVGDGGLRIEMMIEHNKEDYVREQQHDNGSEHPQIMWPEDNGRELAVPL